MLFARSHCLQQPETAAGSPIATLLGTAPLPLAVVVNDSAVEHTLDHQEADDG